MIGEVFGRDAYGGGYTVGADPGSSIGDSSSWILTDRYLWGSATSQILADEQVPLGSSTVVWALTDNQGSVRDLLDSMVSGSAHYMGIWGHTEYTPFGAPLWSSPVDFLFEWCWLGRSERLASQLRHSA
jgi:hypothetical protein